MSIKHIIISVLYECETWFLTLREGHKLILFENRVINKILGHDGMK
jgi:hypothetical protein